MIGDLQSVTSRKRSAIPIQGIIQGLEKNLVGIDLASGPDCTVVRHHDGSTHHIPSTVKDIEADVFADLSGGPGPHQMAGLPFPIFDENGVGFKA